MDAGEMLITAGHEARRVHSSKAGPGAAKPQSAELNLFHSEALQLSKADASAETPSLPRSLHVLYTTPAPPEWVGVGVCMWRPMKAFAFEGTAKWNFSLCDAADLGAAFS